MTLGKVPFKLCGYFSHHSFALPTIKRDLAPLKYLTREASEEATMTDLARAPICMDLHDGPSQGTHMYGLT